MDELKNFTDKFREEFENDPLPQNHKERFMLKLKRDSRRNVNSNRNRQIMFYFAAASVALFLIFTPVININKFFNKGKMDVSDYTGILEDRSKSVVKLAESLNPNDKAMVLSTLDQLTFEAVSFESQLPEGIVNGERTELIKNYYAPKIEGVDKLEEYARLLKNQ
ncbi:MAG: hypothetical protein A2X18_13925 [Bacteroidetes bacterium GWF2_40_14]|nr:MAG: hypothetical protein A2X18_13925 [Bacteroidetes bacterium GWF2_40_14]